MIHLQPETIQVHINMTANNSYIILLYIKYFFFIINLPTIISNYNNNTTNNNDESGYMHLNDRFSNYCIKQYFELFLSSIEHNRTEPKLHLR